MTSQSASKSLPPVNTARAGSEMAFKEGEIVGVPCTIQPGPFPNERLIAVETEDGPFSGFAKQSNLRSDDGEQGFVEGVVIQASRDAIVVRLFGSFFRTALGIASVQRSRLTRIEAAL
jgi:hypothetical protein